MYTLYDLNHLYIWQGEAGIVGSIKNQDTVISIKVTSSKILEFYVFIQFNHHAAIGSNHINFFEVNQSQWETGKNTSPYAQGNSALAYQRHEKKIKSRKLPTLSNVCHIYIVT